MSIRSVGVGFSAAADGRAVTIDRHTTLVAVHNSGLVSTDPTATFANRSTSPANETFTDIIFLGASGFSSVPLSFPLSAGEVIFVSRSGAGTTTLFFNDP